MYSYHRLWLSKLVLALLTTTLCGLAANEVEISESHDAHILETQAAASLREMTDGGGGDDDLGGDLHNSIRFEPPYLDFGVSSVGLLKKRSVTVVNQHRNLSVYIGSVSAESEAFYSIVAQEIKVPPNGNTTMDVVFWPREEGAVCTSLYVHTSFGKLQLRVRGDAIECPYRLKPLVATVPLNANIVTMVHIYNPHGTELQIERASLFGLFGYFKLEPPSEFHQGFFDIPPYTTSPIIRLKFWGEEAGKYSTHIRIQVAEKHNGCTDDDTDSLASSSSSCATSRKKHILILPIAFEVLPTYGLYAVNPILDFGYLTITDNTLKPFEHKLVLSHSKSKLELNNLQLESITSIKGVRMVAGDDDNAASSTILIDPQDICEPVTILNKKLKLVYKDTTATSAAHTYHNVELIIRAHIFKGSLHYDENSTLFLDHKTTPDSGDEIAQVDYKNFEKDRHIMLRNEFQAPLVIYNVTTPHNESSKLSLYLKTFESGLVLKPGHSLDLIVAFRLAKKQQQEDLKDLTRNYKTAIYVYTNITNFQIPIVISSTRLFVTTQNQSIWRSNNSVYKKELLLSSITLREISHKGYVILQNNNSIPIKLKNWNYQKSPAVHAAVIFLCCIRSTSLNKSNDYTIDLQRSDYKFGSQLNQGDIAVFQLNLQPYIADQNTAYLNIETSYENITITIKFSIVSGKLEVDQEKLHFANCFPGKLCSSELSIRSNFKHAIHMKSINFTDPGLRFEDRNPHGSKIAPQAVTTVGRIFFEPSALCGNRCYIPQQTDEASTFPTTTGMENSLNIPHFDEAQLRRRTELYRHFKYFYQNLVFSMTTKDMQHFQMNLMIEIQWPQLVKNRQVLPTIEVNKSQVFEVKISNPSDQPILIDYMLADPTLAKQTKISLPLEVIVLTPSCYLTDQAVFSLVSQPPKKPILIPPLSSIKVLIQFEANSIGNFCTLLHIRNNLTLYEGVWISAKAVQSQFRLGNRKPGSLTPLLFEITEEQLSSACSSKREESENLKTQPQVTSRRVFTARNSGELPIWIESFWIGDQPCKGYGFQVMDCKSFELKANSSKIIEIIFQSDFTVTRVSKSLTLRTNLSYAVNYMLVAQLPSKGLEQCNALLTRPPWEEKIRNATIVMLIVTFVLVLVAVHIDYGNIMYTQSSLYGAREKAHIHPTFNLRNIAMRSTEHNNTEVTAGDGELNQRNKSGLKKRNIAKNQKQSVVEASSSSSFVTLPNNMTLAEMVSWTFGSKTTKKTSKTNRAKEQQPATPVSSESSATVLNDLKPTKGKLNEKLLMDKMDDDLKKPQVCKRQTSKVSEKTPMKCGSEDQKSPKDDSSEKEVRKEKIAVVTKSVSKTDATDSPTEQRKSMEISDRVSHLECLPRLPNTPPATPSSPATTASKNNSTVITPMAEITNQQFPLPKDNFNGRKIGKTPGRERRKQSAQNTSPATSSCSSASTSSSSCSLSHYPVAAGSGGKRYERQSKNKASSSLKFSPNANHSQSMYSAAAMAAAANGNNDQTFHQDVLSPWDYSSHATFSDVLQQTQQFANAQAAAMNSSPLTSINNDLIQHSSSLFDVMSTPTQTVRTTSASSTRNMTQYSGGFENSEITTALTPKRPIKPTASDLGPIGSRKSPSLTPASWESLNSAIPMQLPRPLNSTSATTATPSPYDLPALSSNFGYNDLMTARQTIQQLASANSTQQQQQQQQTHHDFDIVAKLRAIKAHEIMRLQQLEQHLLMQQQHQQYLNYTHAINNNWSAPPSTSWTPFIGTNGDGGNMATCSTGDVFGSTVHTPSSTWSLSPTSTQMGMMQQAPSADGVMEHRYSPQHLAIISDASSDEVVAASINSSAMTSSKAPTTSFDNSVGTANGSIHAENNNTADNMPMFNLFGGLSSIWNDNWKQQSTEQQPQQQRQ